MPKVRQESLSHQKEAMRRVRLWGNTHPKNVFVANENPARRKNKLA